jgi:hypothetical protein
MLGMNNWYVKRFKSMSFPEMIFRAGKMMPSPNLKKQLSWQKQHSYTTVPSILPHFTAATMDVPGAIDVFGIEVRPSEIKDWSFDVYSGNVFPKISSKEISIRTGKYGSAKHAWEINRMLFLPQLALKYKRSSDVQYLNQVQSLVTSWTEQNPYSIGINWYSNIEVNIRLINWFLTWEILEVEKLIANNASFKNFVDEVWIPSIYEHCKFSYTHPSLYSSANNHLISEFAGLFIASSKWCFQESRQWKIYAKQGLEKEIIKQHTENGINKEEAAEYIQFITDFFLLSLVVGEHTQNSFSHKYKERFRSILNYINNFLDVRGNFPKYGDEDDGRVCLLNKDADNNFLSLLLSGAIYFKDASFIKNKMEPDQKNLILFGEEATLTLKDLRADSKLKTSSFYPEEGHFIFRKEGENLNEIYCHFDAAPLGYLSIAAHGHSDALSFVLHVDGQPFFIDPGTYCYHTDPDWRRYFVSTRAHNTICINNSDQAHFVGPTLWLDHYKIKIKDHQLSEKYDCVFAEHDGYQKFNVSHSRKIEFFRQEERILITDYIFNKSGKEIAIEMPFHIHPDVKCSLNENDANLAFGKRKVSVQLDKQLQWSVVKGQQFPLFGWYSNSFYKKTPSSVIIGAMRSDANLILRTELLIT